MSAFDLTGQIPKPLFAVSLNNDRYWWGIGVFCEAASMLRFLETGDTDALSENKSAITRDDRALVAKLLGKPFHS
ncbi:hypothetical protein [Spirosoma luteolum]